MFNSNVIDCYAVLPAGVKIDWSDVLPEKCGVSNPYNVPVHDQEEKCNCTSHAFSFALELCLSDFFHELALIDVDDLWENQLNYGTANESGDFTSGCIDIIESYGVKFSTKSGLIGRYYPDGYVEWPGEEYMYAMKLEFKAVNDISEVKWYLSHNISVVMAVSNNLMRRVVDFNRSQNRLLKLYSKLRKKEP